MPKKPLRVPDFIHLRPVVYHSTNRANLPRISRLRRLEPAAEMIRKAGRTSLPRTRRTEPIVIDVEGEPVVLRDQEPLRVANAELAAGWTEGDFVLFQNEHVFFWPGDFTWIVNSGARLLDCYDEQDAVLRIPTADLLAANLGCKPLFCAFNSGAPRKQRGKAVPRGPELFLSASRFPRSAGRVVEMAFRCAVQLPATTQVRLSDGSWRNLFTAMKTADELRQAFAVYYAEMERCEAAGAALELGNDTAVGQRYLAWCEQNFTKNPILTATD